MVVACRPPDHRGDRAGVVVPWLAAWLFLSVLVVVVLRALGAHAIVGLGGGARTGIVAGAVVGIGASLGLGLLARGGRRPITRVFVVASVVQLIVLTVLLTVLSAPVASALRHQGHWLLALAGDEPLGRGLAGFVAGRLAPAPDATTATTTSTTTPTTTEAAPATKPATSTGVASMASLLPPSSSAKDVFAARSGSVVVVQVRRAVDPRSLLAIVAHIDEVDSHGSGFVVEGGYVVTNHHVIERAASAAIRFADGRVFDTITILVDDPRNDLALLSVGTPLDVPAIPLVDDEAPVGESVIVIGSPLGLDFSLSSGLVSARREQETTKLLQIDATIAPGSSGGPAFNTRGGLLGVTTATSGAGLNFAVAASHVRAVLAEPRGDRTLPRWTGGFALVGFDVEGPPLPPFTRTNLLGALPALQQIVEGCVGERGAGDVVVTVTAGHVVVDDSVSMRTCLAGLGQRLGYVVNATIAAESAVPSRVVARYSAPDGRTMRLVIIPGAVGSIPSDTRRTNEAQQLLLQVVSAAAGADRDGAVNALLTRTDAAAKEALLLVVAFPDTAGDDVIERVFGTRRDDLEPLMAAVLDGPDSLQKRKLRAIDVLLERRTEKALALLREASRRNADLEVKKQARLAADQIFKVE